MQDSPEKPQTLKERIRGRLPEHPVLRVLVYLFAGCTLLSLTLLIGGYIYIISGLPSLNAVEDYRPNLITKIYSGDGLVIGEYYKERRTIVPLDEMPDHLIQAFLSAEDAQFYEHKGIDYRGIMRAIWKNLQAGRVVQGASTITQQVAKSFFLTPERRISRKIREAILASRMENRLSKDDILFLYLSQIYFGNGAYGVQAASERYFGKDVGDLTVAEAALIAGLPKAPSRYSPYRNPELARKRQEVVITRMLEEEYIKRETAEEALNEFLKLRPRKVESLWVGPYFTEMIRKYILETYGEELLYKGGLRIYSTLDVQMQRGANIAVENGLRGHDKRRGYRGPFTTLTTMEEVQELRQETDSKLEKTPLTVGSIYKGLISEVNKKDKSLVVYIGSIRGKVAFNDLKWASLFNPTKDPDGGKTVEPMTVFNPGDVILVKVKKLPRHADDPIPLKLEQDPEAEAALLAIEPETGFIKAMVGGSGFRRTEFNRAVQAKRQPGSAFKPVIYATALDHGYTPATIIVDSPLVFENVVEEDIVEEEEVTEDATGDPALSETPKPDKEGEEAADEEPETWMWKPRNFEEKFYGPTTIRTALTKSRNVVTVKVLQDIGVKRATKYARKLGIKSDLAADLSLALGSSALTLLEMTSAFSTFANLGTRAEPLFITKIVDRSGEVLEEAEPVTGEVITPQTSYIITSLLKGVVDSGTGWRARLKGRRPAAGKTGTTNNLNDAWFIGYVPGLTAGAWIGYDEERVLGENETGNRAAAPIWKHFMDSALVGTSAKNVPVPEGVEFARIDPKTGLLANPTTEKPVFEVFKAGTAPTEVSSRSVPGLPPLMDDDFPSLDERSTPGKTREFRDTTDDFPLRVE